MEQILIVGAGYMGAGRAQVCAQNRYQVHLYGGCKSRGLKKS